MEIKSERSESLGQGVAPPPWIPAGSPVRSGRLFAVPMTGTKRNEAVEHNAIFLTHPSLSPVDPRNQCWLYTMFDFKAQIPFEEAQATTFRNTDILIEKMRAMNPPPPPVQFKDSEQFSALSDAGKEKYKKSSMAVSDESAVRHAASGGLPSSLLPSASAMAHPDLNRGAPFVKGHFILDIIATRRHVGTEWTKGLPYKLGQEVYRYLDERYADLIVTSFIGITDNTARRTGRDIYYFLSTDLNKSQIDFTFVDNYHMFIVFPEMYTLHGKFPDSMLAIRRRQEEAEQRAALAAEQERIRREKELAAMREPFVVRKVEYDLNLEMDTSTLTPRTRGRSPNSGETSTHLIEQ